MRIYIAGKTGDIPTVRMVQNMATACGHKITHDWTKTVEAVGGPANEQGVPPDQQGEYAMKDAWGVYTANLVVACGHPHVCGTLWECGMAIGFNVELWLYRWDMVSRHSVFEYLPSVTILKDTNELYERLWHRSEKRMMMESPPPIPLTAEQARELGFA